MHDYNNEFWLMLDKMFEKYQIVIDRPKGTSHPKNADYIYPLDYGYLAGTVSSDGAGIDIWVGSSENQSVSAIICTVDSIKGDSEIKILYSCTNREIELIYKMHNRYSGMKGLLNKRKVF